MVCLGFKREYSSLALLVLLYPSIIVLILSALYYQFDKIKNSDYDNLEENIFMVQFLLNEMNSSLSIFLAPVGGTGTITVSTLHFGGIKPTDEFYNSYDPVISIIRDNFRL